MAITNWTEPIHECQEGEVRREWCYLNQYYPFFGELKQFAEKLNCSFFILPSSIHEVILVPDNKMISLDKFVEMVQDINATQVHETEILSDSVYYYDKTGEQLRRVG